MAADRPFVSLADTLRQAQAGQSTPDEFVKAAVELYLGGHRDAQTVLDFDARSGPLGPGRLIGYDSAARTVCLQLLGEAETRTFGFDDISDFGEASWYNSPKTFGDTLLAAYWEARVARRYLERMVAHSYARLSPEEVDAFGEIVNVDEAAVAHLCPLDLPEAQVKQHLCGIIGNPFAQKDWGGEVCDIFCSIQFRRRAVPAAFILKGKSYARRPLRIADLGKNGDQLVRMFSLPAELFIVQSNGPVDGAVYSQVQAQVAEKLMSNQPVYYLVLDGLQTARLLRAYGNI